MRVNSVFTGLSSWRFSWSLSWIWGYTVTLLIDILWPITNAFVFVKKEVIRAILIFPLNAVGAHEKSRAVTWDGIDSVFAVFDVSAIVTLREDVTWVFTLVSDRREKKGFRAVLVFISVSVSALVEGVTFFRNWENSFPGFSAVWVNWLSITTVNIFRPIADRNFRIKIKTLGAFLVFPSVTKRALVKFVALSFMRVDTIFTWCLSWLRDFNIEAFFKAV